MLRAFSASGVCFARDESSSKRVGGVRLSRKPPKLRSSRYTQPSTTKATAGVAVRCWQFDIDTARYCHRVIRAAGERSAECATADLRRAEAAVLAAKPASALLFDTTAVSYLAWVCGRVGAGFVMG